MKKIALVVPSLAKGGGVPAVARFIKDIALSSDRYDVKLISLCMASDDETSLTLRRPLSWLRGVKIKNGIWDGLTYSHVGANFADFEFQRYKPRKLLEKLVKECDLIQVVCGSPAWANSVIGLGKPVSLQVATLAKVERRSRDKKRKGLLGLWRQLMTKITNKLDERALQRVDAIQLENKWMLDFSKNINSNRCDVDIRYAPPGIDTKIFNTNFKINTLINPYILCVGRLDDPRKNINLLLKAFSLLPSNLSNVHLITAGSGMPPSDYWEQVVELGLQSRVKHVTRPKTEELVDLYQQAVAFALPSDEEGLGVVVLEAMACGTPVVATRCGGPDGIITDGTDGFLVPLDDEYALSERLARLCLDPILNRYMSENARFTIEARYARDVCGQAFIEVWDSLTGIKENA